MKFEKALLEIKDYATQKLLKMKHTEPSIYFKFVIILN